MRLAFSRRHFVIAVLIFVVEVLIARFVHDAFVRPFIGDLLVVVLLYALLKSFCAITPAKAAIVVFVFACVIETLQYFHLPALLGLAHHRLAVIVLGATFDVKDLLAYAMGGFIAYRFVK
jgi:hypothetical protein